MAKGKQSSKGGKGTSGTGPQGDRVVYSEFSATARPAALERGTPDLPPGQQSLRVSVSRKGRGGKTVTVVTGFAHHPDTLTALAKRLKAHCGTGGTAKDNALEIQGDHAAKVVAYLQQQGYEAKRSGG